MRLLPVLLLVIMVALSCKKAEKVLPEPAVDSTDFYDVVVYGSTPAGITAAVQVAKMQKSVIIVSTNERIGGMVAGGLSNTDVGEEKVIGGRCLDFFKAVGAKYGLKVSPKWTFEPKVALQVFQEWMRENQVPIASNDYLDLKKGVEMKNSSISSIRLQSGRRLKGKVYIDASYEGDLMAQSQVSYTIGREAEDQYNESLAGAFKTIYTRNINSYIEEGNVKSGLLPQINVIDQQIRGSSDSKIQAFNFRVSLTKESQNMVRLEKPATYNELDYELLIRATNAYPNVSYWTLYPTIDQKVDANNGSGIPSFDYVGMNYDYFKQDYAGRKKIKLAHENYIKGLIWTLQNHPRIPKEIRDKHNLYGLARDEFQENNNWPTELYIREGRRMQGTFVMTQKEVLEGGSVPKPVGMGSYGIDCHGVQFFAGANGKVNLEGSIYVKVPKPYQISYESIVPRQEECKNLIVPVCVSASHVAYCSIRMEPQYMILGQAAGTAAVLSIESKSSVQEVDYNRLRERLLRDNQILSY